MNYKVIYGCKKFVNDRFLSLPSKLYKNNDLTQDYNTEYQILNKKHILSKYFDIIPFIVIDKFYNKPVARCMLTYYPKDNIAYFGFFECVNSKEIANLLLTSIYKKAKDDGKKKIVGPVDASFWIKYRLKNNLFNKNPYTGEPYNKKYYFELLTNNGFTIQNHYTSNIYPIVDSNYNNEKFQEHFKEFIDKGYEIKSPSKKDYKYTMEKVYDLIIDLYSDFPVFKYISKDDFMNIFKNYKYILDFDMVKMAYYKGDIVGFFISVPNYKNLPYNLNLKNFIKILKIKKKPSSYVMLYMGVDKDHTGLGKALSNAITFELKKKQVPSIGALARDGKLTQNYAKELIKDRYEYVLLEKEIKNGKHL